MFDPSLHYKPSSIARENETTEYMPNKLTFLGKRERSLFRFMSDMCMGALRCIKKSKICVWSIQNTYFCLLFCVMFFFVWRCPRGIWLLPEFQVLWCCIPNTIKMENTIYERKAVPRTPIWCDFNIKKNSQKAKKPQYIHMQFWEKQKHPQTFE